MAAYHQAGGMSQMHPDDIIELVPYDPLWPITAFRNLSSLCRAQTTAGSKIPSRSRTVHARKTDFIQAVLAKARH